MQHCQFVPLLLLFYTDNIYVAHSTSKYIIDDTVDHPLPIDVCMKVDGIIAPTFTDSIIYSCDADSKVIKYRYANNADCSSSNPITTTLQSSEFNCVGPTNYLIEEYYQNEVSCLYGGYFGLGKYVYILYNIYIYIYIGGNTSYINNMQAVSTRNGFIL